MSAADIPAAERPTCGTCGRSFGNQFALYSHTKAKHGRKAARAVRPPRKDDGEQSMAAELVEAIEAAHAGEPVPEHLLTMFPDSFPHGTKARPDVTQTEGAGR